MNDCRGERERVRWAGYIRWCVRIIHRSQLRGGREGGGGDNGRWLLYSFAVGFMFMQRLTRLSFSSLHPFHLGLECSHFNSTQLNPLSLILLSSYTLRLTGA